MTAKLAKFKVVFKCLDSTDTKCYVTVDCCGPNIPEESIENKLMLMDACIKEFTRLNVTPLDVEGINNDC